MLPAFAFQQKLSKLNLKPQTLCGHRNLHQRLPSSKHIKGQTSGWEKAKVSLSVFVHLSACCLQNSGKTSFITLLLYRTQQTCQCWFSLLILLARICEMYFHTWQDSVSNVCWGCMLCCMEACNVSALGKIRSYVVFHSDFRYFLIHFFPWINRSKLIFTMNKQQTEERHLLVIGSLALCKAVLHKVLYPVHGWILESCNFFADYIQNLHVGEGPSKRSSTFVTVRIWKEAHRIFHQFCSIL